MVAAPTDGGKGTARAVSPGPAIGTRSLFTGGFGAYLCTGAQ